MSEMKMARHGKLVDQIKQATRACFSALRTAHPEDTFCAFALYSDESAMTVCPSANTVSHLQQRHEEDPDDSLYYTWSPAEWQYEFWGHEHFDGVQAEIDAFHDAPHSDDEFARFQAQLFEACVAALAQLRAEGFFDDHLVVFSVSDWEDANKEIAWAARLNSPAKAEEFRQWITNGEG
ncbi:DUF4303 domain-containing protein [Achromobacter sp. GG226]|uniref:DUF4303 domain-containing protein n=1 Tax=Verticiella alkaliphila TaxID=2779529 RepID=UPI001C0D45F8|nr:DUF4303 domain-containing protein [Verticiella sp. GG226]MBU4609447.1 DUF4303 domain-containing protein [Verticiella sp. GG226]